MINKSTSLFIHPHYPRTNLRSTTSNSHSVLSKAKPSSTFILATEKSNLKLHALTTLSNLYNFANFCLLPASSPKRREKTKETKKGKNKRRTRKDARPQCLVTSRRYSPPGPRRVHVYLRCITDAACRGAIEGDEKAGHVRN